MQKIAEQELVSQKSLIEKVQGLAVSPARSVIGSAIIEALSKGQGKTIFIHMPDGSRVDMSDCSVSALLSFIDNSELEPGKKFLSHIAALHAALLCTDAGNQWLAKNRYSRTNSLVEIILIARSEIKIAQAIAVVSSEPADQEHLKNAIEYFSVIWPTKNYGDKEQIRQRACLVLESFEIS